jgi:hypothetical protein
MLLPTLSRELLESCVGGDETEQIVARRCAALIPLGAGPMPGPGPGQYALFGATWKCSADLARAMSR